MTTVKSEAFGVTRGGEAVTRWTLANDAGMSVGILNYGCTVQGIVVPDCAGNTVDVALGYDDLSGYEAGNCFYGAFVGRYANRIKGAQFELNGKTYRLEKNDGENHLHGIYCRQVFDGSVEGDALVFRRVSPDGEEGYPGTLRLEVRYTLRGDNALVIAYRAETDTDTMVNFTNHSYFNLDGGGDVLDHTLKLAAGRFTESGAGTLPTGNILSVDGTPMDFRKAKTIGQDILSGYEQLAMCMGYDHNYILDRNDSGLVKFVEVRGARSGILMECFTTQPAVQLYTGNYVDTDPAPCGKSGVRYPRYAGVCLETQHYPCSPNYPQFPSTVLHPGNVYSHETVYRFSN